MSTREPKYEGIIKPRLADLPTHHSIKLPDDGRYCEMTSQNANASLGHPEFLKIIDEIKELHQRKAADYGRGADCFANVRASQDFGIPAWVGVMVRLNDKVHRIKSYILNGSLKNESLEDSLKDLAAYAIIALALKREQDKCCDQA